MNDKNPLDIKRSRGGRVNIGTEADGAIKEMYNLGGRVLVIKEKSIYELRMADDIDPNRLNPDVPPSIQKLILPLGTTSEMFSRTFLTARRLFKPEYFKIVFDTNDALSLAKGQLKQAKFAGELLIKPGHIILNIKLKNNTIVKSGFVYASTGSIDFDGGTDKFKQRFSGTFYLPTKLNFDNYK